MALGYRPERLGVEGTRNYARTIMKSVVAYLRHGVLYYHYMTEIPETGPGSGEYAPINHMFPITPVALHEGWIEGKERTITAISGNYRRMSSARPRVHRYDLTGRERPATFLSSRAGRGWQVEVKIKDWEEIVVIE